VSNRVTFQLTKFVNLDSDLNEQEPAYGYRVYDDYGSDYNNVYTKEELPRTPQDALEILEEEHNDLYDAAVEKGGFFFNDDYVQIDEDGKIKEEV